MVYFLIFNKLIHSFAERIRKGSSAWIVRKYGTRKSSSILVRLLIKFVNSRKASKLKLRLTSSIITRGTRSVCLSDSSRIIFNKSWEEDSLERPNAKICSFESRTRTNFFFPNCFSCFPQSSNRLFLVHTKNRGRILGYNLFYLCQVLSCLFNIFFLHVTSFLFKFIIYSLKSQDLSQNIGVKVFGSWESVWECQEGMSRGRECQGDGSFDNINFFSGMLRD